MCSGGDGYRFEPEEILCPLQGIFLKICFIPSNNLIMLQMRYFVCSIEENFLQNFLEMLMQTLQSLENLKEMFVSSTKIVAKLLINRKISCFTESNNVYLLQCESATGITVVPRLIF